MLINCAEFFKNDELSVGYLFHAEWFGLIVTTPPQYMSNFRHTINKFFK